MPDTSNNLPTHSQGWVLIANSARARSFVRDTGTHAMRELCSFVHPESREKGMALGTDRSGKVHKGVPSTQFAPHTDLHDKAHAEFARELAQYLEEAALGHRYQTLAIIASKRFLGDLRAALGPATQHLLSASVPLDLSTVQGAALEQHVAQALLAAE